MRNEVRNRSRVSIGNEGSGIISWCQVVKIYGHKVNSFLGLHINLNVMAYNVLKGTIEMV